MRHIILRWSTSTVRAFFVVVIDKTYFFFVFQMLTYFFFLLEISISHQILSKYLVVKFVSSAREYNSLSHYITQRKVLGENIHRFFESSSLRNE